MSYHRNSPFSSPVSTLKSSRFCSVSRFSFFDKLRGLQLKLLFWFRSRMKNKYHNKEADLPNFRFTTRLSIIVVFKGAISPIIPSAPKYSSRHFTLHRKCYALSSPFPSKSSTVFSVQEPFFSQCNYSSW